MAFAKVQKGREPGVSWLVFLLVALGVLSCERTGGPSSLLLVFLRLGLFEKFGNCLLGVGWSEAVKVADVKGRPGKDRVAVSAVGVHVALVILSFVVVFVVIYVEAAV